MSPRFCMELLPKRRAKLPGGTVASHKSHLIGDECPAVSQATGAPFAVEAAVIEKIPSAASICNRTSSILPTSAYPTNVGERVGVGTAAKWPRRARRQARALRAPGVVCS